MKHMKQKLMIKLTAVVTIVATLLGGCGTVGETKIEYERLVKALDEGDMATITNASDEGYASVIQNVGKVQKRMVKEGIQDVTLKSQKIESVFNTKQNVAYGVVSEDSKEYRENEKKEVSNMSSKEAYNEKSFIYQSNEFQSKESDVDLSEFQYVFDKLSGLSSVEPTRDTRGLDEPNAIYYSLTEEEFQKILNDNLKISYNKFHEAKITIYFSSHIDRKDKPMQITEIKIGIGFEEQENNQTIESYISIDEEFNGKASNKEEKESYVSYQNQYSGR